MGKTKTAFISDLKSEEKSGKEAYLEKQKKKAAMQAAMEEKAKVTGVGLKGGERIKMVGGETPEPVAEEAVTPVEEEKVVKKEKQAKVRSKKYKENTSKVDRLKLYSLKDAVRLTKETSYSKFDGTVEIHVVTKSDINKQVELPFSTGKSKKIEIADDKTVEKLKTGKVDFDVLLATPEMMPKLVPFAKLLGPRGLMPNPKNGTLVKSAKEAEKFSGNTISVKTQKDQNVVHMPVGKVSQDPTELEKNISTVLDVIDRRKIVKIYVSSTMGPSVKVQV